MIAAHTLYQGLINRVWQSGDQRHGLLLDLEVAGATVLCSDTAFLTAVHSGYREIGVVGYDTGFLEEYDCRAAEVGFALDDFTIAAGKPHGSRRMPITCSLRQEQSSL